MDDRGTAEIIQFPVPFREPVSFCEPPRAPERLGSALSELSVALSEQQAAIARWRQAATDLAGCMRSLSGGLAQLEGAARLPRDRTL